MESFTRLKILKRPHTSGMSAIVLLVPLYTLLLCLFADCAQSNYLPYCNRVVDDDRFLVKPIRHSDPGLRLYDVIYSKPKTVAHDDCVIADGVQHGLRINFDKMKLISDILINATMMPSDVGTNSNAINVSLRQGSDLIQCKAAKRSNVTMFSNTFAVFSCLVSGIGHPSGVLASAVEIRSATSKTLDLKHLREFGILGWLMIMERTMDESSSEHPKNCLPPGLYSDQAAKPAKSIYLPGDVVEIVCTSTTPTAPLLRNNQQRTCLSTGKWSGEQPECRDARWYSSTPILKQSASSQLALGARDITFLANFNQSFHSITEIAIALTIPFEEHLWGETLANNAFYDVLASDRQITRKPLRAHAIASAIAPTSRAKRNVNVQEGGFTVKMPDNVERCDNCKVGVTFHTYHWDDPVVKEVRVYGLADAASTSDGADGANKTNVSSAKECTPIEPYAGMPHSYNNYKLVVDGSINELLLSAPCRERYRFDGKLSEIKQCKDGAWIGKSFPKCQPIMIKSPPKVAHAHWFAIDDDGGLASELVYTCENGYYAKRSGKTTYSIENEEWTNVPECLGLLEHLSQDYLIISLAIVISITLIITVVAITVLSIKRRLCFSNICSKAKSTNFYSTIGKKVNNKDSTSEPLDERDGAHCETSTTTCTSSRSRSRGTVSSSYVDEVNHHEYATAIDLIRDISLTPPDA